MEMFTFPVRLVNLNLSASDRAYIAVGGWRIFSLDAFPTAVGEPVFHVSLCIKRPWKLCIFLCVR
jgi:hypothetical protein